MRIFFIVFCLFLCNCKNAIEDRVKIARVYDNFLYTDQIPFIEHSSINDSLIFVQKFTNNWATHKLLLSKAEFNFSEYPSYIDSLITDYKQSLLIHYYQQAVVETYLDTVVSNEELNKYYEDNMESFTLKEHILKVNYIKIKNIAPNLDVVRNNYNLNKQFNIDLLEDYCLQFAERFFLNDTNWIDVFSLNEQIPIMEHDISSFDTKMFNTHKSIEISDKHYSYFIFIKDYKLKGSYAPLEYVSSIIKKILINTRKKDVLSNIEDMIIKEAIENNNYEIL